MKTLVSEEVQNVLPKPSASESQLQETALSETEGKVAQHPLSEQVEAIQNSDFRVEEGELSEAAYQVRVNAKHGALREDIFQAGLEARYAPEDGHRIIQEASLRNGDGDIVRDPESGSYRRVDYAVIKDDVATDLFEITSPTAPKEAQMDKERRIRESSDIFVRDPDTGELYEVSPEVKTRVVRIDLNEYGYQV